jgi:hypothetical protein
MNQIDQTDETDRISHFTNDEDDMARICIDYFNAVQSPQMC